MVVKSTFQTEEPYLVVDLDEASWDRDISLSLKTVYNVTRPVLPLMFAQRGGRIVMVASTSGATIGSPNWSAYSAAKAGIVGLVRTLAVEVGRHGVTVNAVNPGWINTREVDISARPDYGNTPIGRARESVASNRLFCRTSQSSSTLEARLSSTGASPWPPASSLEMGSIKKT